MKNLLKGFAVLALSTLVMCVFLQVYSFADGAVSGFGGGFVNCTGNATADTIVVGNAASSPGYYTFPQNGTCLINGPASAWGTSNITWDLNGTTIKHVTADTALMLNFLSVTNVKIRNGSFDDNGAVRSGSPYFLVYFQSSDVILQDITVLNSGTSQALMGGIETFATSGVFERLHVQNTVIGNQFYNDSLPADKQLKILNSTFDGSRHNAVMVWNGVANSSAEIRGNTITNVTAVDDSANQCVSNTGECGNGVSLFQSGDSLIVVSGNIFDSLTFSAVRNNQGNHVVVSDNRINGANETAVYNAECPGCVSANKAGWGNVSTGNIITNSQAGIGDTNIAGRLVNEPATITGNVLYNIRDVAIHAENALVTGNEVNNSPVGIRVGYGSTGYGNVVTSNSLSNVGVPIAVSKDLNTTPNNTIANNNVQTALIPGPAFPLASNAPLTITAATKANPMVLTTSSSLPSAGQVFLLSSFYGMTQANNQLCTVASPSGSTFQCTGINSTGYGTFAASPASDVAALAYLAYSSGTVPAYSLPGTANAWASDVTGQSTSQSTVTVVASPGVGYYRMRYYANQNANCTTGSNSVSFTFNWTDSGNARSLTTGPLSLVSAQSTPVGYLSGLFDFWVSSGNVTYASTVSGACATGTSTYDVHVRLERGQ